MHSDAFDVIPFEVGHTRLAFRKSSLLTIFTIHANLPGYQGKLEEARFWLVWQRLQRHGSSRSHQELDDTGAIGSYLGIDVAIENPNVGENLQNHVMCGLAYEIQPEKGFGTMDALTRQDPAALGAAMEAYGKQTGPLAKSGTNMHSKEVGYGEWASFTSRWNDPNPWIVKRRFGKGYTQQQYLRDKAQAAGGPSTKGPKSYENARERAVA